MGTVRFLLALAVLSSHGASIEFHLFNTHFSSQLISGRTCVLLFFIISGFYMSLILNTKYIGRNSNYIFYLSRFLRLWPTYIFVVILALVCSRTSINLINDIDNILIKLYVIATNVIIFGTDFLLFFSINKGTIVFDPAFISNTHNGTSFLIIPVVWTIGIELIFYMTAPLWVTSLKKSYIVIVIAILYYLTIHLLSVENIATLYHFFPSSFLYFAAGSLAYHYSISSNLLANKKHLIGILTIIAGVLSLNLITSNLLIVLFTITVPIIFNLTRKNKIDRTIGEFSYIIYLIHLPLIVFLKQYQLDTLYMGILSHLATILVSILIYYVFDRPFESYRNRLINRLILL